MVYVVDGQTKALREWSNQFLNNNFLVGDAIFHFFIVSLIFQNTALLIFNVLSYTTTNPIFVFILFSNLCQKKLFLFAPWASSIIIYSLCTIQQAHGPKEALIWRLGGWFLGMSGWTQPSSFHMQIGLFHGNHFGSSTRF